MKNTNPTRKTGTMKLSAPMRNVLEAVVEMTLKTRGPLAGTVKRRMSLGNNYDWRTVMALEGRGLIAWGEGVHGEGYAATRTGYKTVKPNAASTETTP